MHAILPSVTAQTVLDCAVLSLLNSIFKETTKILILLEFFWRRIVSEKAKFAYKLYSPLLDQWS